MSTEARIIADIESIKASNLDTQSLYREVCVILFFRYGITPTANKLYQYVRKGSMSAPAEALNKFWEDMREKSRVRIEHPDLPDSLKTAAGNLVCTLWSQAQTTAQDSLQTFRQDAEAAIEEARTSADFAEAKQMSVQRELEMVRESFKETLERTLQLERDLSAERATNESLETQLAAAGRQQVTMELALVSARKDFSGELTKLREALLRSEERFEASEKRAMLEIDRERNLSAKLQKDMLLLRQNLNEVEERHRREIGTVQNDLAETKQSLGVVEGALQQSRCTYQQQLEQLDIFRSAIAERDTQVALTKLELSASEEKLRKLDSDLLKAREQHSRERSTTKPRRNSKTLVI